MTDDRYTVTIQQAYTVTIEAAPNMGDTELDALATRLVAILDRKAEK